MASIGSPFFLWIYIHVDSYRCQFFFLLWVANVLILFLLLLPTNAVTAFFWAKTQEEHDF